MIYTPESLTDAMSNRMSPEKTREMAEKAEEIAEALFELGMTFGTPVTEDELETIWKRMKEDA